MSWQQKQGIDGGANGAPMSNLPLGGALGSALGAVWAASQKAQTQAQMEQALAQVHTLLAQVPDDVNWEKFRAGVARYVAQPARAPRVVYAELARVGRVCVRDAGGEGAPGVPPVVLVPSMVNKGYVLDLYPGHSMVEALKKQGFRVLLVDWGEPAEGPLHSMAEVVVTLEKVLAMVVLKVGAVHLFGYCMGGVLALAAAVRLGSDHVRTLSTAAMPWDFSVTPTHGTLATARAVMLGGDVGLPAAETLPVITAEAMQLGFYLLDPWSPVRRLMAYGEAAEDRLPFMTALEDWLGDGLALDGGVGREILLHWYADNVTLRGRWVVDGVTITPAALTMPWWACVCQRDVLVPALCALPAVAQGKDVTIHMADTGHVGLVCGRRAGEQLFDPLCDWWRRT